MKLKITTTLLWLGALAALAVLAAAPVHAQDRADIDRTQIIGNRELPKVLYIVPWQDPSGIPKIELDPNFTEHEVFRHLYPPAYKRELQYYDVLKSTEPKQ